MRETKITYQIGHYTSGWCDPLCHEFVGMIYFINGLIPQMTPFDPVAFVIDIDIEVSVLV